MALLKEASEIFNETGCVPGIDGEQVPTERIVPDAKAYISETIDDPEIRRLGYVWIYGRLDFKRFVFGRAGGRVLINAGIGRMSALEAMHPGAPSLQFVETLRENRRQLPLSFHQAPRSEPGGAFVIVQQEPGPAAAVAAVLP